MARSFTAAQARQVLETYQEQLRDLRQSLTVPEDQRSAIRQAVEQYAIEGALRILETIPVEEVNQQKEGIRTQLLRQSGYETMADLRRASLYQLIAVNGIGERMAERIRERTRELAERTEGTVLLRLNADDRDERSTGVVRAISVYLDSREALGTGRRLYETYQAEEAAQEALRPALNDLRWFFTGSRRKEAAEEAYLRLSRLCGRYADLTRRTLNDLIRAEGQSGEQAWEAFLRQPTEFTRVLEELCPERLGGGGVYGLPGELAQALASEEIFTEGLKCTLRRYQEWGVRYILHQRRVLLGDEMGLGKTVQAIAAMVTLDHRSPGRFLVVCPASVLQNWRMEIQRHSNLRVTLLYGPMKQEALESWLQTGGVAVTSYENTGSILLEPEQSITMLVADEAHYIKNPTARRTVNVRRLCRHADRLLFMTGTALENRVEEMIQLVEILRPDLLQGLRELSFLAAAPQFREQVAPVYYRRKREEVLTELPELMESREWCVPGPEETLIYETAVLARDYPEARRVSWNVGDLQYSSKARRMLEIVEEAAEEGRKILIFSFFLETAAAVRRLLGDRCLDPINGSVPPGRRQQIVDEFNAAPAGSVLVCQIQSGGTGLNIQGASVVILCEPQFKPSSENQAISRAYRMGQARNVLVYRLLCVGTVDERILELLEEKQAAFDAFADQSEAGRMSLELDQQSFGQILRQEEERIRRKRAADPEKPDTPTEDYGCLTPESVVE